MNNNDKTNNQTDNVRQEYINRIQNKNVKDIVSSERPSKEDPLGSYTGLPILPMALPVQDADDF